MIEWAWTLIAVAGVVVQGWLTHDSLHTVNAARYVGNGPRLRIAKGHLRAGIVFMFVHLLFLWAGVRAILTPDEQVPMTIGRAFTIAAFIVAAILLVLVGWLDRRDRLAVRRSP